MIKVLRPNLQKFFYHTSVNFPPTEDLTNAVMTKIGQDYLRESGFTQHQYIMFRHLDANHPHLHILVNRIGYDGKVLSDSNDFARCEKILRDLEKKYNLTEVISSKQAKVRSLTKDELEMMKRTNSPSRRMHLQQIISLTLASKPCLSTSEFVKALEDKGINVLFNQASTGYVSGISYSYEGMSFTGSKLGSDFKWATIKNRLDYAQERDRAMIYTTNARIKSVTPYTGKHDKADHGIPSGRTNQAIQSPKVGPNRSNEPDLKTKKGYHLASLMNDNSHDNFIQAVQQADLDITMTLRLRKKKHRRRRI